MTTPKEFRYMTPAWAARRLWQEYFPQVAGHDHVLEPTCGDGRMLAAIPPGVRTTAVELDPDLAEKARLRTGREVHTGSIFDIELPRDITTVFGNPPFSSQFMDRLLEVLQQCCVEGARAGMLVPAYFLQTPAQVLRWNRQWTIEADLVPRTLFTGLRYPLIFAVFTKDPTPVLRGLKLYTETAAVAGLNHTARTELVEGGGSWTEVVRSALAARHGRAHLSHLYADLAGKRPASNAHWQAKVRQVLQRGSARGLFQAEGGGVWALTS